MTMLLNAVVLTVILSVAQGQSWWRNAVYYRVLVNSFKDGDGDGLGDLEGATKQLSYVQALGADAVILSPISARSQDCERPGIVDFAAIDDRYGDLDAFNGFLEKAKKLDLKVLVTLPLQTVSTASEWFESSADNMTDFEDRILWIDGTAEETPQADEGMTWQWHEERSAYYGTINKEAIVNLCSEAVMADLTYAQCKWIRRGVSGIVLNPDFPREQRCGEQLLQKMAAKAITCARAANLEPPVILAETSYIPDLRVIPIKTARYYAKNDSAFGAHSVISKALTRPYSGSGLKLANELIGSIFSAPHWKPTWQTSSFSESLTASRFSSDLVDAINLLALTLPGSVIIQQGDELGAADTIPDRTSNSSCWPSALVPAAAPFPWDDSTNGGFTTGEPWLPLAPNYTHANVKTEFADDLSHFGIVRTAATIRKTPAFGPFFEIKRFGDVLLIPRWGNTGGSLLLVSNMAEHLIEARLSRLPGLPTEMTVVTKSGGSSLSPGSQINTTKMLKLAPGETVLLSTPKTLWKTWTDRALAKKRLPV